MRFKAWTFCPTQWKMAENKNGYHFTQLLIFKNSAVANFTEMQT